MNIKMPPPIEAQPFAIIAANFPNKLDSYVKYFSATDDKGRYLPFDELRHRIDGSLNHSLVWSLTKYARRSQQNKVIALGEPQKVCHYALTPLIQKAISEVDRNTTSASLEWISSKIGEKSQVQYLLNDLIEDESISSSQLEGAATTTRAAKDLLKRNRKPRSEDERMILGNYKMMLFAWDKRNEPLSIDLLLDMHKVGVEGIDDDTYTPGNFRQSNDVHVVDSDGNVVHAPPPFETIERRLGHIIDWANTDHDEYEDQSYLHPLIKAITLHFCIGYEHPFRDGNGRVARALFYWYMFKKDFAAFRYIAISVLLKMAPIKYGKSYIHTETDGMDLTYFIEHQGSVIIRAIDKFKKSYKQTAFEIERFNEWMFKSGLYRHLNDKQRTVFQVAKNGTAIVFTIRGVENKLGCSYNTASAVLNGLVHLKLFRKVKEGREWLYLMEEKNHIIETWSS
ncbi:MAG: Fic family protein [Flavobacteriales bacterium]|jgi:Fic family protein